MRKINLMEVINSNLSVETKKSILYNEAEMANVEIFSEYVRAVEIEDIISDIRLYAKANIKDIEEELINEFDSYDEIIDVYVSNMGNEEVLKALK